MAGGEGGAVLRRGAAGLQGEEKEKKTDGNPAPRDSGLPPMLMGVQRAQRNPAFQKVNLLHTSRASTLLEVPRPC